MYRPIQIPYILNKEFSSGISYKETYVDDLSDLLICFWEMNPKDSEAVKIVNNIVIIDGCIDLVVDFNGRQIGFSGMSKTDFNFQIKMPSNFIGARLKPGAFFQLTNIPAKAAMDRFIPIENIYDDFDKDHFFSLSIREAKLYFEIYLTDKIKKIPVSQYVSLFDDLWEKVPGNVEQLAAILGYSERQLRRVFLKYYALTPKTVLSILRFQKCLDALVSDDSDRKELLGYYDQPHYIRDFKQKIGITPFEFLQIYAR